MAKRPKKITKGKRKVAAPKRVARKKTSKGAARSKGTTRAKGKSAAKKTMQRMVMVTVPQHITLDLPPVLHDRLKGLSELMDMPMEAVMRQALTEFADTWEDHHRTVAALAEGSDRMQLVVKD
ncbi:MAG: hypothetical protein EPO08_14535 [Rhodospirillaceae bacterium]|nr:MAG: hypothetical protein EPO08_14535 [Rhodospirillaceae bacterium]